MSPFSQGDPGDRYHYHFPQISTRHLCWQFPLDVCLIIWLNQFSSNKESAQGLPRIQIRTRKTRPGQRAAGNLEKAMHQPKKTRTGTFPNCSTSEAGGIFYPIPIESDLGHNPCKGLPHSYTPTADTQHTGHITLEGTFPITLRKWTLQSPIFKISLQRLRYICWGTEARRCPF